MMNMKTKYCEVRNDYYDESAHFTTIDAWKSDDDNEEGKVVAVVHDRGDYWYTDPEAINDPMVEQAIKEVQNRLGCNLDTMTRLSHDIVKAEQRYYDFVRNAVKALPEKTAALTGETDEPLFWQSTYGDYADGEILLYEFDKIMVGDDDELVVHICACNGEKENTWTFLKELDNWSAVLDYVKI